MTPTEVEQFIRDGQARGLSQDVVRDALLAHVMAEPPELRERTLTGIGFVLASYKSQAADKGLMDAGILAEVLSQVHGGDVEVRMQEFKIPGLVVPSARITCPLCDATFLAAMMNKPLTSPSGGDMGLCTNCGAALTFTVGGGLRLATAHDLARMEPETRREFWNALTTTREQLRNHGIPPATGPF